MSGFPASPFLSRNISASRKKCKTAVSTHAAATAFSLFVAWNASVASANVGVATATVGAAGFDMLIPHRAVYDVKLEDASDRSGIEGMDGRMVYELTDDGCEGLMVRYRFVVRIATGQEVFTTDQRMETYESRDGKEFSFTTKSYVNDQQDQDVVGIAEQEDGGIVVKFNKPEEKQLKLGKAAFLSQHLIEVINKAKEGEHFMRRDIFDGTGAADVIVSTSSVIGAQTTAEKPYKGENPEAVEIIKSDKGWQVSTSYFNKEMDHSSESLPIYEASFLLYPNGISRNVEMRYPDYTLRAQITNLEMLERKECRH